jgi:DNA-binding MarR family transcriptional regulator
MTKSAVQTFASQCLAARLRLLNRLVTSLYDDALRPHGVRISQLNILVVIAARAPTRASDVSRVLKLEKSTLSRDLARLIERGWVIAAPRLEITSAGNALLERCLPAWRDAQRSARKLLTQSLADDAMALVNELWAREGLVERRAESRGGL